VQQRRLAYNPSTGELVDEETGEVVAVENTSYEPQFYEDPRTGRAYTSYARAGGDYARYVEACLKRAASLAGVPAHVVRAARDIYLELHRARAHTRAPASNPKAALAVLALAAKQLGDAEAYERIATADCGSGVPCLKNRREKDPEFQRFYWAAARALAELGTPTNGTGAYIASWASHIASKLGLEVPEEELAPHAEAALRAPSAGGRSLRALAAAALITYLASRGIPPAVVAERVCRAASAPCQTAQAIALEVLNRGSGTR